MADMNFEIKVDNTKAILDATEQAIYNALDMVGSKAADYAAALAPADTGNLRNSLTHQVAMDEQAVYVGTAVEYAPSVELGHHQQVGRYVPKIGKRLVREFVPGQPYLRPAIENNMEEYKRIMENEIKI